MRVIGIFPFYRSIIVLVIFTDLGNFICPPVIYKQQFCPFCEQFRKTFQPKIHNKIYFQYDSFTLFLDKYYTLERCRAVCTRRVWKQK